MDSRLRRVSKLRLRSRDEGLNRRGAILIEDAMRTASLPDADGGRLWIVRKLALGRIRASDPPSAVALRIEARFRESGAFAVHAASPQAAAAEAVYFDDDVEPYIALALRLAQGLQPVAWFWPLAARGWTPGLSRDESMRVLLAGSLASSAGPTAALAFIRALLRHNALHVLATALRFDDGPLLLRTFGWIAPRMPEFHLAPPPRPPDALSPMLEQIAVSWFTAWGATDARSLWLACALYAIERPALAAQSSLPAKAAAWINSVASVGQAFSLSPPDTVETHRELQTLWPATPSPTLTAPAPSSLTEPESAPTLAAESAASPSQPLPRPFAFTPRAGLFFLIPAMQRLGMPAWLDANAHLAQWSIPYLILRAVAYRLETLSDDPVIAALGDLPPDPPAEALAAVHDWIRRLRQFSRRIARIGLHSLICRSGRIVFTETHIDVLFHLDTADIRIRRAGLDIDPGWTPWLPRVIHFHYDVAHDTRVDVRSEADHA